MPVKKPSKVTEQPFSDQNQLGLRTMQLPTREVLLCAGANGREAADAIELGVDGLVLIGGPVATIAECIASVAKGEQWLDPQAMRSAYASLHRRQTQPPSLLTCRQRDVARLVAAGQRNSTTSVNLGISEGTVKMHLHNVYVKLGVESRTLLAVDTRVAMIA